MYFTIPKRSSSYDSILVFLVEKVLANISVDIKILWFENVSYGLFQAEIFPCVHESESFSYCWCCKHSESFFIFHLLIPPISWLDKAFQPKCCFLHAALKYSFLVHFKIKTEGWYTEISVYINLLSHTLLLWASCIHPVDNSLLTCGNKYKINRLESLLESFGQ